MRAADVNEVITSRERIEFVVLPDGIQHARAKKMEVGVVHENERVKKLPRSQPDKRVFVEDAGIRGLFYNGGLEWNRLTGLQERCHILTYYRSGKRGDEPDKIPVFALACQNLFARISRQSEFAVAVIVRLNSEQDAGNPQ